ncbi:MAG TPA: hypothetical protein VH256_01360 [Thermoleophilaceae bacterium]|nr:hypothetical protein [Thermoleophilaceae bacterium]
MPFGELIREAFRIAARHRYLWPFGLFASTLLGGNFNFRTGPHSQVEPSHALVVAGLILFVVFAVGGVISHGGLPKAVVAIRAGRRPGFRDTWREGLSSFWHVVVFGLLVFAIFIGLFFALFMPLGIVVGVVFVATHASAARVAVLVVAGVVLIVAWVVFVLGGLLVGQHALREVVLSRRRPVEALRRGVALVRGRVGESIALVMVQFGVTLGAAIVLWLILGLLALPAILLIVSGGGTATVVVAVVTGVVVVPLALTGTGAIGTFSNAYWTLAYLRLAPQPPSERPY